MECSRPSEYSPAATRSQMTLISAMGIPFQYSGQTLYLGCNHLNRNMPESVTLAFALVILYSLILVEGLFVLLAILSARTNPSLAGVGSWRRKPGSVVWPHAVASRWRSSGLWPWPDARCFRP